jgi:pimeloyl-ACP methyl ester carboxylesterase
MPTNLVREQSFAVNGIELTCFEWGRRGGQQVLLVHATGFHARCWDRVVALLPEDWQVFAVDMRGHGRSSKDGPFGWQQFGSDLVALIHQLELSDAIGVGHSMGGHCVVHACLHVPSAFARLVLVDPVIGAPQQYERSTRHAFDSVEDHPVARRRSHFADWHEMYERYKDRRPYKLWRDEVFVDYCRYGVLPSADGEGVDLACPGLVEASIYMNSFSSDLHERFGEIAQPVTVLRAPGRDPGSVEMDFAKSPTWPELAAQFPKGQDVYLPTLTHFIPMQDPELVAGHIRSDA